MEPVKIIIDGARFSTIDEFFDEAVRLLTRDLTWTPGRGMDAFHDLLRGGFGVHQLGGSIAFRWTHAEKSRRELGYEATARYWERLSRRCHPSNRAAMERKAEAARNHEGATLFDLIAGEILDKSDWYSHTLALEED